MRLLVASLPKYSEGISQINCNIKTYSSKFRAKAPCCKISFVSCLRAL